MGRARKKAQLCNRLIDLENVTADNKISVVIVCKNEEHIIGKTLQSVQSFAAEMIVYDTGSTDQTVVIAESAGAKVVQADWDGFGKTKQKAIALAANIQAPGVKEQMLNGHILHYTMKDTAEFVNKSVGYALVNAQNYFQRQKKATWIKQYLSPSFMFFKYYVLRLGFLDGWAGLFSARMAALYTYIKYARLHELWKEQNASGKRADGR
ncbi:MAG: glycosyltransferase family 2 protein [Chitinophagaceae bacterium]|nr:MAG: glycosyltransferase family 2 protein [Chitinophagaceae bacterium]